MNDFTRIIYFYVEISAPLPPTSLSASQPSTSCHHYTIFLKPFLLIVI